jgi:hypothetical protein
MFSDICALCAELVALFGIALILGVEGPPIVRARITRWTTRSRPSNYFIEMISEVAPQHAGATSAPPLVDKDPTERIPVSEWLRGEVKEEAPRELVPVGAPAAGKPAPAKVRPSIREKRG